MVLSGDIISNYLLLFPAEDFRKGAILAGFPHEFDAVDGITEEEKLAIINEKEHRWNQPWQIYYVAIISSMAAVVQGMEYVFFFAFLIRVLLVVQ